MSKNQVQFQKGLSIFEFMQSFGTEKQCREVLFKRKWPEGFVCPHCGSQSYCTLKARALFQCNACHHQTSLTSHTIFASTKLPLTKWFLAIHLLTQAKTGLSALELKRQIGVSYNTAWQMKQKLMQVMKEADDRVPLSGIIQLDDVYWGGEKHGGKRGRGASNKKPFVAAVQVNDKGHPIRMNMNVVKGFKLTEITRWAKKHLEADSIVFSDGLACFKAVEKAQCQHNPQVTGGGYKCVENPLFQWVNTMIGNVKTSMHGSYHAINPKHLPRYLAEFCYRFNRRFNLEDMTPNFLRAAVKTPPLPYRFIKMAEDYG